LEEIMPSVQRTLFGTAATSLKEYMPLHGVARMDTLIGGEDSESAGEGKGVSEPIVPLHDKKNELRDQHRALVGAVSRKVGIDHRRLNAELITRTGGRVDQATVAQLLRRIALLEKWRDTGYDGERPRI
jgi:hypothetical protein